MLFVLKIEEKPDVNSISACKSLSSTPSVFYIVVPKSKLDEAKKLAAATGESSLRDELSEIETTIKSMHEVWDKSKILYPSYVADMVANTTTFDSLRLRLFLITDNELRKKVVAFYKKLKDTAKKSEGKLGSLAQTAEALAEQTGFEGDFKALGTEAKEIQTKLS